jgi:hypothetical protein
MRLSLSLFARPPDDLLDGGRVERVEAPQPVRRHDVTRPRQLRRDELGGLDAEFAREHKQHVQGNSLSPSLDVGDRAAAHPQLTSELGLTKPALASLPNALTERSVKGLHGRQHGAAANLMSNIADGQPHKTSTREEHH